MRLAVYFQQELGLTMEFLTNLGTRIETARKSPDPVMLASAAKDLAVAERVSGKTAKLTSAQLSQEAAELAMLRDVPVELNSIALLLDDFPVARELEKAAKLAETRHKEAAAAEERGERPKGIRGYLTIKNYTSQAATIYYNGYRLGTLPPYSMRSRHIGDYSGRANFVITAYGSGGGYKRKVDSGFGQNYTFVIRPSGNPGRITTIID